MKKRDIILAQKNGVLNRVYADEVSRRVAERYTISDEIALIRQREEKADEYQEYFNFVEGVKTEVKNIISGFLGTEFNK